MTSTERREQLIDVARSVFAQHGYEGTAVEEIAAQAEVSKPVVYEHFGGKEGLYAVVVDREVDVLLDAIRTALTTPDATPRELIEHGALALLDYIDDRTDGFRILSRDSSVVSVSGSFASILNDVAARVEDILAAEFTTRRFDPQVAPMYAQALVGMVAVTGQWWLDTRSPSKEDVAAHMVNLAWNGLSRLDPTPSLSTTRPSTQRVRL